MVRLPQSFTNIRLHEFVTMPNHFHAILKIVGAALVVAQQQEDINFNGIGQPQEITPTVKKTVGDMVGAFQSIVTVKYIRGVKSLGWQPFDGKLWQRNYYEHIIRDERSYLNISAYIINNPANWNCDSLK